ncbi:PIGO-like protein [Mya arenaria]|uniref:PIGO-like protein n=1 Tax=Mya arenaria TaxID=6604 RepID=A0ABY7DSM7_MYAAR|nr:PIGO-like protein [Mya arenaria]
MIQKSASIVLLLFLFLFLLYLVGGLIFTKGFLLKRDVVGENSTCRVDFARYWDGESHGKEGCWLHRRFNKAVVILIDALRFDFVAPSDAHNKPYLNKLPFVQNLLLKEPKNSRLYRFVADPPTTTLQRLKALTTGSLPTFVDAGSNFASTEISEDNVIDQLVKQGRKLVFLGDDTWQSLFPKQFTRKYPFPSFNVKDLHTVDNGILEHVYTELQNKDWDVLVAHFLGVDHCGHRFGPNHPAMQDKLAQMDDMINADEVDAALLVYSKSTITTATTPQSIYRAVSQVDLVPTLSLLLGVPVPFSNLGSVITDLFSYCSWSRDSHIKEVYHIVEALRVNAQQMNQYMSHYMRMSSDLPAQKLMVLQAKLREAEAKLQRLVTDLFIHNVDNNAHEMLHYLEQEYIQYMHQVREMCRDVWAKFDNASMGLGIIFLVVTVVVNIYIISVVQHLSEDKWPGPTVIVISVSVVFLIFCVLQSFYLESSSVSILGFILGFFDIIALGIIIHVTRTNKDQNETSGSATSINTWISVDNIVSVTLVLINLLSYFSNSFVVFEDSISQFCFQSIVWYLCAKTVVNILKENRHLKDLSKPRTKSVKHQDIRKIVTKSVVPVMLLTATCSYFVRLSANFRNQREEQLTSEPLQNASISGEGNVVGNENRNMQFFLCSACFGLVVYLPQKWLKESGNLNGVSGTVLCARYLVPMAAVSTVLYWALQQTGLAQLVYLSAIISMVMFLITPLCVYMPAQPGPQLAVNNGAQDKDIVGKLFSYMKSSWEEDNQQARGRSEVPRVFGLGTVYTAALIYTGLVLVLVLSLLLGSAFAPSFLTALMAAFMFLELFSIAVRACRDTDLLVLGMLAWSLLMTTYFYGFGHQATIPAIRFEAAFVGFHGDWELRLLPAGMIHSNMFAAEILFTFLAPLLLLWPCTNGLISGHILSRAEGGWQGDFVMYNNPTVFRELLLKLTSYLYLLHGGKMLSSVLAAAVHRRHLMVWKIFAPRFVFQAMASFTVFGASVLSLAVLFRVEKALEQWTEKLK